MKIISHKELGRRPIYRGQEVRSYYIAWYKIPKHTKGLLRLFHECEGSNRVFKRALMTESSNELEYVYFIRRRSKKSRGIKR